MIWLTWLIRSRLKSKPASDAMAAICKTVLVEQPSAMSTAKAFSKASFVKILLGVIWRSNSSNILMPADFASRLRAE